MIARLHVLLPFSFLVPEGAQFTVYAYTLDDYEIHVYPPVSTDVPIPDTETEEILLDGQKAFRANALRFDFKKSAFDRRQKKEPDPPYELLSRAVNSVLARLRYVARSGFVKSVDVRQTTWRIDYLNDNGSELAKENGLVNGRFQGAFKLVGAVAVTPKVWETIYKLPANYEAPRWISLLLDASVMLPEEVGPAIVLAYTALEILISVTLNKLAGSSDVPPDLWNWITDRGDFRKEPSTEEQFDFLLRVLSGSSLKKETRLWEGFKNLKNARHSFVHKGEAVIGRLEKPLSPVRAGELVTRAFEIVRFVRELWPEDARWPEYSLSVDFNVRKTLGPWQPVRDKKLSLNLQPEGLPLPGEDPEEA